MGTPAAERHRSPRGASLLPQPENEETRYHREALATIRLRSQRLRRVLDSGASDALLSDATRIAAEIAAELRAARSPATSSASGEAGSNSVVVSEAPQSEPTTAASRGPPAGSDLSPRLYYDIYLAVTAELRVFEMYVAELVARTASLAKESNWTAPEVPRKSTAAEPTFSVLELYERAQTTLGVIPRLYLLITVGGIYLRSAQAPVRDILRDLSEMCCGVQHPQRGLFLRAYLAQTMMRDMAEARHSEIDQSASDDQVVTTDCENAIDFLLRNFTEMNRLWVRMQHDCPSKEREQRERDRKELRLLVGINISKIAAVPGVTEGMYRTEIFPAIAEQIISCHDPIAQDYLCDCITRVFPDEYHLLTLDEFLKMCGQLTGGVDLKGIIAGVTDRLSSFAQQSKSNKAIVQKACAFQLFEKHIPLIVDATPKDESITVERLITIYLALLNFAVKAYPDNISCVDTVYGFCVSAISSSPDQQQRPNGIGIEDTNSFAPSNELRGVVLPENSKLESLVVELLEIPLLVHRTIDVPLQWKNWLPLSRCLCTPTRKRVAVSLMKSIDAFTPCLHEADSLELFFDFIEALVEPAVAQPSSALSRNQENGVYHPYLFPETGNGIDLAFEAGSTSWTESEEEIEFRKEQGLLARIVYMLDQSNEEWTFYLCKIVRRRLAQGGSVRGRITLPPLINLLIRLATRLKSKDGNPDLMREVLVFASESISGLADADPELALRLFLKGAIASDTCQFMDDSLAYDFVAQAFLVFEEELFGSRAQFSALLLVCGTLDSLRHAMPEDLYAALVQRASRHASRLLTKADQSLALCAVALLYWDPKETTTEGSGINVVKCLDRAEQTAQTCMSYGEKALLLLDVLVRSMYFYERGCNAIGKDRLTELLEKISCILESNIQKDSAVGRAVAARFARIKSHMHINREQYM